MHLSRSCGNFFSICLIKKWTSPVTDPLGFFSLDLFYKKCISCSSVQGKTTHGLHRTLSSVQGKTAMFFYRKKQLCLWRTKEDDPFKFSIFGVGVVISTKHIFSTLNWESRYTVELQIGWAHLQSGFGGAGTLPNMPLHRLAGLTSALPNKPLLVVEVVEVL
jgi:hypothetical protein